MSLRIVRFSPHHPKVGGSNPPRATTGRTLRNRGSSFSSFARLGSPHLMEGGSPHLMVETREKLFRRRSSGAVIGSCVASIARAFVHGHFQRLSYPEHTIS